MDKFNVKPNRSAGLTSPMGHAVCGRHLSTVKLLLKLGADLTKLNRSGKLIWILAKPINLFDKANGHLINSGREYQDIVTFLTKNQSGFSSVDMALALVTGICIGKYI